MEGAGYGLDLLQCQRDQQEQTAQCDQRLIAEVLIEAGALELLALPAPDQNFKLRSGAVRLYPTPAPGNSNNRQHADDDRIEPNRRRSKQSGGRNTDDHARGPGVAQPRLLLGDTGQRRNDTGEHIVQEINHQGRKPPHNPQDGAKDLHDYGPGRFV